MCYSISLVSVMEIVLPLYFASKQRLAGSLRSGLIYFNEFIILVLDGLWSVIIRAIVSIAHDSNIGYELLLSEILVSRIRSSPTRSLVTESVRHNIMGLEIKKKRDWCGGLRVWCYRTGHVKSLREALSVYLQLTPRLYAVNWIRDWIGASHWEQ